MGLRDISRKGALTGLAALSKAHPQPLSAPEFVAATGMDAGAAIRLRQELVLLKLIVVETTREQGSVKEYAISLTPLGTEVGQLAREMESVFLAQEARVDRAARKKRS